MKHSFRALFHRSADSDPALVPGPLWGCEVKNDPCLLNSAEGCGPRRHPVACQLWAIILVLQDEEVGECQEHTRGCSDDAPVSGPKSSSL